MVGNSSFAYLLPVLLFVILSLPFDRIKTLIAKSKRGEGSATFE
jgi:hypothetical protein